MSATAIWDRRLFHGIRAAVFCALLALGACADEAADAQKRLAQGQEFLAAGDLTSAILELKSAVQADINNQQARFLLAQAYLKAGNAAGALKEFTRARKLGLVSEELNLGITRAMIMSGKFDQAATEISITGKPGNPEWLVLQAMLDQGLDRHETAKAGYLQVLEKDPRNVDAHRGLLQTELALGNRDAARAEVAKALEATQDDFSIWMLKGQLDMSDQQFEEARTSYEKALSLAPKNPAARLGLATALVSLGSLPEAIEQLDELGRDAQEDPRINYLRALIAQQRGEPEAALRYLRKVLQIAPNHVESMILTAKLNLDLGDYPVAEDTLRQTLAIAPGHEGARRMLGAVQLASGHIEAALESTPDLNIEALENPQMLALLGAAYLRHGRYDEGEKSLAKAHELDPASPSIRTQLALSKLTTGKAEEALSELAEVREQEPDFTYVHMLSVAAHLHRGEGDRALAIAREFLRRHPDMAMAHNMVGFVEEQLGQAEAARRSYEAALAVDEAFHPAQLNLARLDHESGNDAQAKVRLKRILVQTPHHPEALLGLASLAIKDGAPAEAERLWQEAREHNRHAVAPRLLLANRYLTEKKYSLAQDMATEAHDLAPFSPVAQHVYATVMMASGNTAAAVPVLERLAQREPVSIDTLGLLADAYNRTGDIDSLEKTLQRITAQEPDSLPARIGLAKLAGKRGDHDEAYGFAERLIAAGGESAPVGYALKGDLSMAAGKPNEAIEAYARAQELAPASHTLLALFAAEKQAGRHSDRLTTWLEQHPDDANVRLAYAMELQAGGRKEEAVAEYERVLAQGVDNPAVLNNLAWLYHESGRDRAAVDFARRAFEAAPAQAEIMDTYGWILVEQGKHEQGLDLIRKAAARAPRNGDIRYHLAAALAETGDKKTAVKELETLLGEDKTFMSRPDAEALMRKLSRYR